MITAIYLILGSLCLLAITYGRGHWAAKTLLILGVVGFSVLLFLSGRSTAGYPAKLLPPPRALFVWGSVVEPDRKGHDAGRVYLWLIVPRSTNPLAYRPREDEPRAFSETYSRSLHEAVYAATQATRAGVKVEIRRSGKGAPGAGGHSARGTYHAYVLPPASLPRKTS